MDILQDYNDTAATETYCNGFTWRHVVYGFIHRGPWPREWTRETPSSRGIPALRVYFRKEVKQALIAAGIAKPIGPETEVLTGPGNAGEQWEHYIFRRHGRAWHRDKTPYWVAGDIEINGEQVQVKFHNATLTNAATVEKAKAAAAR